MVPTETLGIAGFVGSADSEDQIKHEEYEERDDCARAKLWPRQAESYTISVKAVCMAETPVLGVLFHNSHWRRARCCTK